MVEHLRRAFDEAAKLPEDEQIRIAEALLADLAEDIESPRLSRLTHLAMSHGRSDILADAREDEVWKDW